MSDDRLDLLDYYDLLQVDPGATADAVRDAFHAFARRYHPDRFAGAAPEKQARAAQIYRRGTEAYRVLSDDAQRAIYDRQIATGLRRLDAEAAREEARRAAHEARAASGPEVRSARARPLVETAQAAMREGQWKVARLNLQLALGHEPGHPWITAQLVIVEEKLAGR